MPGEVTTSNRDQSAGGGAVEGGIDELLAIYKRLYCYNINI